MSILVGFGISSALSAALRAVSLPLMGWLVAPALLAEFALWQLALGLLVLLAGLGLGHAINREFHALSAIEQPLLLGHALALTLLVATIIGAGAAGLFLLDVSAERISFNLVQNSSAPYLFAAVLLQLYLALGAQYLRLQQRPLAYAQIQTGGSALWLVLLSSVQLMNLPLTQMHHIVLLWLTGNLLNAILLTWTLQGDLAQVRQQRQTWFNRSWRNRLRHMLRYGHPLQLSEFLYWAISGLGAILLTAWHGLETMAIYAMAVAIGSAGSMAGQVFNTVWLPEVYRAHQQNAALPWLSSAAAKIIWTSIALVLLATAGSFAFVWLLPEHYAPVPYLVAATFLKPVFMALQRVSAIGIELQRATWVSPCAMALALSAQVLLAWWLIPAYAAAGAVISMVCAAWLFWQLKSLASSRLWRSVGGFRIYLPMLLLLLATCTLAMRAGT